MKKVASILLILVFWGSSTFANIVLAPNHIWTIQIAGSECGLCGYPDETIYGPMGLGDTNNPDTPHHFRASTCIIFGNHQVAFPMHIYWFAMMLIVLIVSCVVALILLCWRFTR